MYLKNSKLIKDLGILVPDYAMSIECIGAHELVRAVDFTDKWLELLCIIQPEPGQFELVFVESGEICSWCPNEEPAQQLEFWVESSICLHILKHHREASEIHIEDPSMGGDVETFLFRTFPDGYKLIGR